MKLKLFFAILCVIILTGCSNHHMDGMDMENSDLIDVDLSWDADEIKVDQEITFQAAVTQDGEVVTDAKEVRFEFWKESDPESAHEEVYVKSTTNNEYQVKRSFSTPGKYYVISHVSARGVHNMPKKSFDVVE